MIEIKAYRYSVDWSYLETHNIDPEKIIGFEIHWRCSSWHVVVVEKANNEKGRYSYDLSHWVEPWTVVHLIMNPEAKILNFINYHHSSNFIEGLGKIFELMSQDKHRKRP